MASIVICGASGLVGSLLGRQLHERGDSVIVVGRDSEKLRREFPYGAAHLTWAELEQLQPNEVATLVNLAGAGVMEKRWDEGYKDVMMDSRLISTEACANICAQNPQIDLINASSVHTYGVHPTDHSPFVEGDLPSTGKDCFLYEMARRWEGATLPAVESGARVVTLRIGVVLSPEGGALIETAKPFKLYLGGRHGTGKQIMSWISLRDLVNAIVFLVYNRDVEGPVNMVSPAPCTNSEFARALGAALGKSSFLPMPSPVVRAVMGQAGLELVLLGQRVLPEKLLGAGFRFQDREIHQALREMF
ncbi:MAG: TIGR01777 family oxidoreductase [Pseudomonadota bacterium]